jgi:hypothetical protein
MKRFSAIIQHTAGDKHSLVVSSWDTDTEGFKINIESHNKTYNDVARAFSSMRNFIEARRTTDVHTHPNPTGLRIAIPADWEIFFPEDRFVVGPFDIELERIEGVLAVDIAYLGWEAFREELLKPEHASLARHMGTVMRYLEIEKIKENYI